MVEEESDDSSEYSDDEDELGNKVSISGYIPQNILCQRKNVSHLMYPLLV